MKAWSSILFSLLFCLSLTAYSQPKEALKNQKVVLFHYPPYMNQGITDGNKGLEVEIFEEASSKLNLQVDYDFLPIKRAVSEMQSQNPEKPLIYIGTSKHFVKEIESGEFNFVKIGNAKFVPFVIAGSPISRSKKLDLVSLKKYKVAALRGSSVVAALEKAEIKTQEVPDFASFFSIVGNDRVDASIVLDIAGEEFLKSAPDKIRKKIIKLPFVIYEIPLAIVIAKNHPNYDHIYNTISNSLSEMRKNGRLRAIAEKYYGKGKVPQDFLLK